MFHSPCLGHFKVQAGIPSITPRNILSDDVSATIAGDSLNVQGFQLLL